MSTNEVRLPNPAHDKGQTVATTLQQNDQPAIIGFVG